MRLFAPKFWRRSRFGFLPIVLTPFSFVTRIFHAIRMRRVTPLDIGIPVFCCGNLSVGGTGKTIVALDLVNRLRAMGHTPHILSRGYKGQLKGPLRVDPQHMTPFETGDEPLMMAQYAPVWIGGDRRLTALKAREAGADCLVMDDGLQNPGLKKSRIYIVLDGAFGLGNRRMLPAGPLREPWKAGLEKADAVILIGADTSGVTPYLPAAKPIWRAQLVPGPDLRRIQNARVIAFTGIGRPGKFFEMLQESGLNVLREISFPDHHVYTAQDLKRLSSLSQGGQMQLVTTEKDAIKLPADMQSAVHVVKVALQWEAPDQLKDNLAKAWDGAR